MSLETLYDRHLMHPVVPTLTTVVKDRVCKLWIDSDIDHDNDIAVRITSRMCGNTWHADCWCVQPAGHQGPCWDCSKELYLELEDEGHAWAIVC